MKEGADGTDIKRLFKIFISFIEIIAVICKYASVSEILTLEDFLFRLVSFSISLNFRPSKTSLKFKTLWECYYPICSSMADIERGYKAQYFFIIGICSCLLNPSNILYPRSEYWLYWPIWPNIDPQAKHL